jgi:hydroxyacylglutathione hydrolase
MLFEQIVTTGLEHYSYIIGDQAEAIVIDPRRDVDIYVQKAEMAGFKITHILETHRNEDYLIGSPELAARTEAEIWHADSQFDYRYGQPVQDGQTWKVGGFKIEAMHTPGHTPGMMNYVLYDTQGFPWVLFSGDTLFAGDVGRVDLMGEDRLEEMAGLLYDSIFDRLLPLGDEVSVCPAHGAGSVCGSGQIAQRVWTTIGIERKRNPRLQHTNRDGFIEASHMQERPPYFSEMEARNMDRPHILGALPYPTPLSPHEFAERARDGLILDTRLENAFNNAHIPGALSIWSDGLSGFAGWFVPHDRPLYLVMEGEDTDNVTRQLVRMGYDQLDGYLAGGMNAWHKAGKPSASIETVTVQDVCASLDRGARPWTLDVRGEDELEQEGEIVGAHHIHITQLPQHLSDIPRDKPVRVFCGSGLRSTIAASLLERQGWDDLSVVLGGTTALKSADCPIKLLEPAPVGG